MMKMFRMEDNMKGDKMTLIAPDTSKVPPPKSNTNTICRLLSKAQKNKIK